MVLSVAIGYLILCYDIIMSKQRHHHCVCDPFHQVLMTLDLAVTHFSLQVFLDDLGMEPQNLPESMWSIQGYHSSTV